MRRSIIVTFLAPTTLAQDTSRIRTRSSTNAVCTNTPVSGPLPTSTFLAVLSAHLNEDEECPRSALLNVHYHNEDDVGCCTQSAILTVASGTPACCSCGATCTGSVPSMVDWTFTAGQFVTTAVSQLPTTSGTLSPTPTAAATETGTGAGTGRDTTGTSTATQVSTSSIALTQTTASPAAAATVGKAGRLAAVAAGLAAGVFAAL